MRARTANQLRCFCGRKTLLGVYGVDTKGKLYIHVKVFKQDRVFAELLFHEGSNVDICCRDCLRWHHIRIATTGKPVLEETSVPLEIAGT
jgi:hypothetical protein